MRYDTQCCARPHTAARGRLPVHARTPGPRPLVCARPRFVETQDVHVNVDVSANVTWNMSVCFRESEILNNTKQ